MEFDIDTDRGVGRHGVVNAKFEYERGGVEHNQSEHWYAEPGHGVFCASAVLLASVWAAA